MSPDEVALVRISQQLIHCGRVLAKELHSAMVIWFIVGFGSAFAGCSSMTATAEMAKSVDIHIR